MPAVQGRRNAAIRYGGIVARLELGRIGVVVEFRAGEGTPAYAVIPMVGDGGRARTVATDTWGDILRDIHRRAPPDENE